MFLYLFGYFLICLTDLFDLDPLSYLVIYCSFKTFLYNAVCNFSFKSFLDILACYGSIWILELYCQLSKSIPLECWLELHEIYEIIFGHCPTLPSCICLSRNAVLQTSVLEFTESSLGAFSLHAYGACKNSHRFLYTTKHFTSLAHGFALQIHLRRGKVTYPKSHHLGRKWQRLARAQIGLSS